MADTALVASSLTGAQKAAVVLLQLSKDQTSAVLRQMTDEEVERLMGEVASLGPVSAEIVNAVGEEFIRVTKIRLDQGVGGMSFVRDALVRGLGDERAMVMLERIQDPVQPFSFIQGADRRQVVTFLVDEHPQTIALVLVHLNPGLAAVLLDALPLVMQGDVARRVAIMERPTPEVAKMVERTLERKLATFTRTTGTVAAGGVLPLVAMLNRSVPATEQNVLDSLAKANPTLGEEVRRRLFVFADIVGIDDRAIQLVLRDVNTKELAMALKGAPPDVRAKVMSNLSERASTNLGEEIELLGPVRLAQVEEARDAIVKVIRALEEAGQIVLSRGADDLIQ
jgi:flagellar motor switch protein FliG